MATHCRIELDGDLTVHRVAEWWPRLLASLSPGTDLCVGLAGAARIDSAGVQLLLMLRREAAARRMNLQLEDIRPEVHALLEFYRLDPGGPVASPESCE
ncbi:STAS domain-containing protein [Uliginosibacterium sp. H1]|uniref:STAS domain-containing protein n=1 Tax=Uliginosibacterium sp. H1 TaxID=3114757 RepID=UPI002E17F69D|nr:STAS domain-containing protein [Uliginosibacterium sp. H1]